MRVIFLLSITIIILFIFLNRLNNSESFQNLPQYISQSYYPSYFELNPLICYVSESESYLDKGYFKKAFNNSIQFEITNDPKMKFKADLALLPEPVVLDQENSNNEYPYDFVSHIKDISFSFIQLVDSGTIKTFNDIQNYHIYIKEGGYVEYLYKKIFAFIKFEKDPKITYYSSNNIALEALESGKCDAIAFLASHPNEFIQRMSYKMKINIVPWDLNENLVDVFAYYLRGLKRTKIKLKEYNYTDFNTELLSYGYNISLFINKNLHPKVVEKITSLVFRVKGITRSSAIGGSLYVPFHEGTKQWLKKFGYISITESKQHPSCALLVGKAQCNGKDAKYAKQVYDRDFWGSKIPNDQSAVSYLRTINEKKNNSLNGKIYSDFIEDNAYMCVEDLKKRTKEDCEKSGNTWDKPCLSNDECPFYKSNQNYNNDFGKCINGFCEMPLGVMRKGYTQYLNDPICHNCPASNPSCCEVKENMPSPDYAFKNDRIERILNEEELNMRRIAT
tara:strand:- start:2401 stop:3915 length:1515 start_codon:yes stop_codon:yes gene_type:complete